MHSLSHSLLFIGLLSSISCANDKSEAQEQVGDANPTPSETDLDGDGLANEDDIDADGDGVPVTEDCDDTNPEVLSSTEDLDCDGTVDSEDSDQDGDGFDTESDCDDRNPDATSVEEDADCDGVPTAEDCDDTTTEMGSSLYDVDCDGYPGFEDCDDRNPDSTIVENDSDCDGIINDEDAFPEDAAESGDSDGDGVGDNSDLCDGGDDSVDEDGNGVPDHCDQPGWLGCTSDRQLGTAEFEIIGLEEGEWAGAALSFAGDVDGDGLEDYLIGTSRYYLPDPTGRVYLVLGSSILPGQPFDLVDADYVFMGEQINVWGNNDYFGLHVAGIGDYNGDGLDDLLFGANWYFGASVTSGRAYLVLGSSLGMDSTIHIEDADITFYTLDSAHLGQQVAAAGDVNGDGLADILLSQTNQVSLFYGTETIQLEQHTDSADLTITSPNGLGGLGNAVSSAGDIDGDGLDDLMIGQPYNGGGSVHIVKGSSIATQTNISSEDADYIFTSSSDLYFGTAVAPAGDVDGDGLDDILLGSSYSSNNGSNTGSTYVMLGSTITSGSSTTFDVYNEADYKIFGAYEIDMLGRSIAPAGDFNGDGLDDFLVSAHGNDYAGQGLGSIYLFSGASLPYLASNNEIDPESADFKFIGESSLGGVEIISKRPGDADNDGFDDVLISAKYAYDEKGLISVFTNCE